MPKKLLSILLAAALLLLCVPAGAIPTVEAATYTSGDYTYSVSGTDATITKYSGSATDLTVPDTLGGYPVTAIGNSAFYNNKTLQTVIIPDSVLRIEGRVFEGCTALRNVTLSENLVYLGYRAFTDTAIESIRIPKSLDSAGYYDNCSYTFNGET